MSEKTSTEAALAIPESSQTVISCIAEMRKLEHLHPAWWADYEDSQLDVGCERGVLEALLASAPTPFAAGVVFGKMMLRQQIATVTRRPFE